MFGSEHLTGLFVQGRGALRRELTACLRTGRTLRTPRARVGLRGTNFVSPDIMIYQRLAEAELVPSVGSVGDSYDNALAETINGLYKARSSGGNCHGQTLSPSKWKPCAGSTGSTITASSAPLVTSRRHRSKPKLCSPREPRYGCKT